MEIMEKSDILNIITDDVSDVSFSKLKVKRRKPGIVYLSTIPPTFTVPRLREYFSKFGQIEKIFLQPVEQKSKKRIGKRPQFSEGWIEFKSKRKAKMVHTFLNNHPVGGKKSNPDYDFLWNIKYLPRFKWAYLRHRLEYESQIRNQRMKTEILQVSKETDHYIRVSDISKKMEKKQNSGENNEKGFIYKQKLTEEEILKKRELKKLKNEKYKQKLITKKKAKKSANKKKQVDTFADSIFVGNK